MDYIVKENSDMKLLEGKVALVTGGSRGIGKAVCRVFAQEGAVVFAGIRDMNRAEELTEDPEDCGKVIPIQLDVCDETSVKKCILEIKKAYGKLDILVNNAGIIIIERFEMMRRTSLEQIYATNVFGLINVTQTALRLLKKSGSPVIINMSSILAGDSDIGQTAYASSKAAVVSMTKTLAKEFAPAGFRVNAIAPGNVDTDMFNIIDKRELDRTLEKIGMHRIAKPEEIANVALFLASDMASYVTGEIIGVNGGLVL